MATTTWLLILLSTTCRKRIVIKIIKRKSAVIQESHASPDAPEQTVTETVNDWIKTSRENRLDEENQSRETIAGWTAETK